MITRPRNEKYSIANRIHGRNTRTPNKFHGLVRQSRAIRLMQTAEAERSYLRLYSTAGVMRGMWGGRRGGVGGGWVGGGSSVQGKVSPQQSSSGGGDAGGGDAGGGDAGGGDARSMPDMGGGG